MPPKPPPPTPRTPAAPVVMAMALAIAGAMTMTTACVFDANVDNGAAQITCGSDGDCPPSWTCVSALCSAPVDVLPPRIVDVSFDPSVARANVPVRLTVVADEELGADPLLAFSGDLDQGGPTNPEEGDDVSDDGVVSNGGFTLLERSGARAVYERTFAPAGDVSFVDLDIRLDSVTVEDTQGNRGDAIVDEGLFVDRSAPLLTSISANAERFSAVAPFSEVIATVELGEYLPPPASLAVFLGEVPVPCALVAVADNENGGVDEAPPPLVPISCIAVVDDATPEGAVVLQAVASDAAGNIAVVGTTIVVDRTPPSVVGVATVTIDGSGGASASPTMVVGATVSLDAIASEPLSHVDVVGMLSATPPNAAPAFIFTTTLDRMVPERISASYVVEPSLPVSTYRADAVLVDDVGNVSSALTLDLTTPLVVAEGVPSPCVATQSANGAAVGVCTDFDHDGFVGASAVCVDSVIDCHDDDPFIHRGADAFDIAGDLTDNTCNGGQGVPLDETTAVFISSEDGDDDAAGTRAAPKRSLRAAIAALDDVVGARRVVAMRVGAYTDEDLAPVVVPGQAPFTLIGGFDAAWEGSDGSDGSGGESVFTKLCDPGDPDSAALVVGGPVYVVDVTIDAGACERSLDAPAVFLRRAQIRGTCNAEIDGCYVGGVVPVLAWRTRLEGVRIFATTLTVLDSTIVDSSLSGDDVDVVRSRISGVAKLGGARARVISSVVAGSLSFGESLEAYHATLSSDRIFVNEATTAHFDNSLIVMSEAVWSVDPLGDALTLRGSDLFAPCVTPSCTGTVEACSFPGCAQSTFSFNAPPLLDLDGVHLTGSSPLLNAGVENSVNLGAPTSSAGDIDGECRSNATSPDIGADEKL